MDEMTTFAGNDHPEGYARRLLYLKDAKRIHNFTRPPFGQRSEYLAAGRFGNMRRKRAHPAAIMDENKAIFDNNVWDQSKQSNVDVSHDIMANPYGLNQWSTALVTAGFPV